MRPIAAYGVRRTVLRHLAAAAPGSLTGARLRVAIRSTDRHALDGVLAELVRDGVIVSSPAACGGRRFALHDARENEQHNVIGEPR